MSNYHFDKEMTKQELQIENRYLRSRIRRLSDIFTDLDIELGKNPEVHRLADKMLLEINKVFRECPTDQDDLVHRLANTLSQSSKDTP